MAVAKVIIMRTSLFLVAILLSVSLIAHGDEIEDIYSKAAADFVVELNLVRQNPPDYAKFLEAIIPLFDGLKFHDPSGITYTYQEGVSAVKEAINVLKSTKPLESLSVSKGLTLAAQDHGNDLGKTGKMEHLGSDGSRPLTRMNRYGRVLEIAGEDINYEGSTNPRQAMIIYLADYGVPDRGHRKNILDQRFKFVGVFCGPHPESHSVCVMDLSGAYLEIEKPK